MAGGSSYPTLGLAFDLNEVLAGQAALDRLKASYVEVGNAAQDAAAKAATSAQSIKTAHGGASAPTVDTSGLQATAAAQQAALAQVVAATEVAAARMIALWQGVSTSQVGSAQAGAQGSAAATQAGITAQMAAIEMLTEAVTSQSVLAELAQADAATNMAAITAGRVDAEMGTEGVLGLYRHEAQVQQIAEAEATANAVAASTAASVQARIAEEELLDQYILDSQVRRAAATQAANQAEVSARATALAEEEALVQDYIDWGIAAQARATAARTASFQAEVAATQAANDAEVAARAQALAAEEADEEAYTVFMMGARAQQLATAKAAYDAEAAAMATMREEADAMNLSNDAFIAKVTAKASAVGKSQSALLAEEAATRGVSAATADAISTLADAEKGMNNLGGAGIFSAGAIRELVVIIRELGRGDFSRLAGSLSIELQRMGALGAVISALPWIAAVAGAGAFAVALNQGQEEMSKFNTALNMTGDFANVTATELDALGHKIGDETATSVGKADEVLLKLVQSGKVSGDSLQYVGESAVIFAKLTGESADKALPMFLKMFDDPVKSMKDLDDQYHYLTLAQYEHIEALVAENDKVGASNELAKDTDDWLKRQTQEVGFLDAAWRGFVDTLGRGWQALKDIGKEDPAQSIANDKAVIANIGSPTSANFQADAAKWGQDEADVINAYQKAVADLATQEQKVNRDGSGTQQTAEQKTAHDNLQAAQTLAKDNETLLKEKEDAYDADLAHFKKGTADYDTAYAARSAVFAKYQKMYGSPVHGPKGNSPDNALDTGEDAITALKAEMDAMASGNVLGEVSAKMTKAADDALNKATNAGGNKAGAANTLAANAAEKEGLTLTLASITALDKETQAHQQKINALNAETAAQAQATSIMLAYYSGSDHSPQAFSNALKAQNDAQLQATNSMSELDIAQKFHVTSVDEISAAYAKELVAGGMSATEAKERGDQVQAAAQKDLDAADAINTKTLALANQKKLDDALLAGASVVDQQTALNVAYKGGYDALVAYNHELEIKAELLKGGASMTSAQAGGIVDQTGAATALAAEQKITYELGLQSQLANAGSVARLDSARVELAVTDLISAGRAQGLTLTRQDVLAQAQATAEMERQVQEANQLKITIQNSIRDGFANTGNLDFSSFSKAIEASIRKGVYDALLAQPIDMVVHATVDQLMGSGGLGSIFGSGGLLSGLTGGSSQGLAASADPRSMDAIAASVTSTGGDTVAVAKQGNSLLSGISGQLGSLPSLIGGAIAATAIGTMVGGVVSNALGIKQNSQNAEIGAAAGAVIGSIIPGIGTVIGATLGDIVGGLLGPAPSNFTATSTFDAQGNVQAIGGDKPSAATTAAITQVANTVQPLVQQLAGLGIDAAGIIQSVAIGTRDSSKTYLSNGTVMTSAAGDATALGATVEKAMLENAKYSDPKLQAIVDAMLKANDSMTQINNTLTEYQSAQTLASSIANDNMQYVDPQAYQLQQLQATQLARREQVQQYASEGVITPDQLATLDSQLSILEKSEIGSVIGQFATTVGGATQSLADYAAAQTKLSTYLTGLATGALSPLSPAAQLAADRSAYQTDVTGAQSGDVTSLDDLPTSADAYLTAAQKYYGSSAGYSALYGQVTSQLGSLATASPIDPNTAAITAAVTSLNAAIAAAGVTISTAAATTTGTSASPSVVSDPTGNALLASIQAALDKLSGITAASGDAQTQATSQAAVAVAAATSSAVLTTTALQGGLITKATGIGVILPKAA